MKKHLQKFMAALALLLFMVPAMVTWGQQTTVLTLDCATPAPTGTTSTAFSNSSAVAEFLNSAAGLSSAANKITCSNKTGDVYKGKGNGGGDIPQQCLKVGKASGGGGFTFTLPNNYEEVDVVEITCYGWKTTSSISINDGTAQTFTTAQSETTKIFELASSTRTIKISVTSSAVCITEILLKKNDSGGGTPTPSISVSPNSIDFGSKAINPANPYTQTFEVSFANLSENLTVTGFTGVSVSPATINYNATSPQTVTVSYNPTAAGSISGNISVNSSEVNEQTVAVTGSAYDPTNVDTYERYTGELVEGDYIICANAEVAMKNVIFSSRFANQAVTVSDNKITNPDASIIWHIAPDGDYYTMYNAAVGKYAAGTSSNNQGTLIDAVTDYAKWNITYQYSNYTVICYGRNTSNNKYLRRNGDYGWATYANNTGNVPTFYKKVIANQVAMPTFSIAEGTYYEVQSVTMNCTTAGATIYYTTDGTTPSASNGTEYTSAVSVSSTTTIKAIAVKSGMTDSDVATATYTVELPLSTIAQIYTRATEVGNTATPVRIAFGNWVVTGANNSAHAFVSDGTNGFMIYGSGHGFSAGDVLSGTVECNVQLFNGAAEITGLTSTTTGLTVSSGGSVTVSDIAMANLAGINTGDLVSYQNLTCEERVEGNYTNYYLSDGTTEIQAYKTLLEGYANYLENGKTYNITGVFVLNNSTKRINPRSAADIVEVVSAEPSVTVTPNTINAPFAGADGSLALTYENITEFISFDYYFCDANGNELEDTYPAYPGDWIYAEINEGNDAYTLDYIIDDNDGAARTAYIKVYTFDDNEEVVSAIVTINQAEYVIDYATLPFTFNNGKNAIEGTNGLTQSGLGSDYADENAKLKFDSTDDYVILKINERPGTLTFNIKGNSFSGGTFKVQTSADGVSYSDLTTYNTFGNNETFDEIFDDLNENVRYIKWIYTEKVSGNVGLGNIALAEYVAPVPSITVASTTISALAAETDGTLTVTYTAIETDLGASIYWYTDNTGTTTTNEPNWITAGINETTLNVDYLIEENTGAARTAYFKVYGLDADDNDVYSDLVTIMQAAAPQPHNLTVQPFENLELITFVDDEMVMEEDGTTQVTEGTQVMLSIVADEGYVIESLMVNGVDHVNDIAIDYTYTFTMPDQDVTISATAAEDVPVTTGTITFGNSGTKINAANVTGDDSMENTWTITTTGTASFTQNTWSQVGTSGDPAESITFTTTLPAAATVTMFEAKLGGYSSTVGDVTLKVDNVTVGSGRLNGTTDVIVNNSITATGTVLTVSVSNIGGGGVKCYYISYTVSTEEPQQYTVYFFEGTGDCDVVSLTGSSITLPTATISSADWSFAGWSTAPTNETNQSPTLYTAGSTFTPEQDINLYAVYSMSSQAGTSESVCQKTTSIAVGDQVCLVHEAPDNNIELSSISTTSTKYGIGTAFATVPQGLFTLVVVEGSSEGSYAFKNGDNYLCWTSGNSLNVNGTLSDNTSWTVSFDNGNAEIANSSDNTRVIRWNNGSPRFACYTSGQQPVQLYKLTSATTTVYNSFPTIATTQLEVTEGFETYAVGIIPDAIGKTDVKPTGWTVVSQFDPKANTKKGRPQVRQEAPFTHSGQYCLHIDSLTLLAMPKLADDINLQNVEMELYVTQSYDYQYLVVGVMSDLTNPESMDTVAIINNIGTAVNRRVVSFSNYTGNGRYIVFGNAYSEVHGMRKSFNYIDDIKLYTSAESECSITELPSIWNFENGGDATTDVLECWTIANKYKNFSAAYNPQINTAAVYVNNGQASLKLDGVCLYAMPELKVPNKSVLDMQLEFYVNQYYANCSLLVGVLEDMNNPATFVALDTISYTNQEGFRMHSIIFSEYADRIPTGAKYIAFRNVYNGTWGRSPQYIDDIKISEIEEDNCGITTLPYTQDFDMLTDITSEKTGVQPECWTVVKKDANYAETYAPQLVHAAYYANSGTYTLLMDGRCIYAMPEFKVNDMTIGDIQLEFYVHQYSAACSLQVGVMSDLNNPETFVSLETISNDGVVGQQQHKVIFSNYANQLDGAKYIAFRNVYNGTWGRSPQYIDDIKISEIEEDNCGITTLPYTQNFDILTDITSEKTGVQPECWTVVKKDANYAETFAPQLVHAAYYANSGTYTLLMDGRCIYAMPEFKVNDMTIGDVQLEFYVRQYSAACSLQVGVMSDVNNPNSFVSLAIISNEGASGQQHHVIDFSEYEIPTGAKYIAFRNTYSGTWGRSPQYIDDITLSLISNENPEPETEVAQNQSSNTENTEFDNNNANNEEPFNAPNAISNFSEAQLSLYPNPTSGKVTLVADEVTMVEVYSQIGSKVASFTMNNERVIDLGNLPKGVYILRVTMPQGVAIRKVVKN